MNKFIASIIIYFIIVVSSFATEPTTVRIAGIYSNLEFYGEEGDFGGMEIIVVPDGAINKYVALVQVGEGPPPYSVLVPFEVKGNKFSFRYPKSFIYGEKLEEGFIEENKLIIIENGSRIILNRGQSFWQ